jgi:hypothetical protein
MKYVRTTITLPKYMHDYIKDNHICLSRFLQSKIEIDLNKRRREIK